MSIEEKIKPGKILYLQIQLPFDDIPHDKYLVVVCKDPFMFLKINKRKDQTEMGKRLKERQFRIKKSQYEFLEYDSFLDCGTVWKNILSADEAIHQLVDDSTRYKGELIQDHKNEVIRLAGKSRSIDNRHKRTIAKNFRETL